MAKNPVKVGIWGLGRAGYGMHCNEIDRYKGELEVVAGCDILPERTENLKKRYPDCKVYTDAEQFLADKDVELVAVAVRSTQHIDYAIRALEAGKFVFVEKPVGLTGAAVEKLEAAMAKYPGKTFFRQNRRFEAAFNHVREIIDSGILGKIYEIKLCRHGFQYREDWQAIGECGGGQLNNWGPHLIDHTLRLMDAPIASIWSDLKNINGLGDAEDNLKVVFKGENGRIIDVEIFSAVALPSPIYAVYGDRGTLICEDEQDIRLKYLAPEFQRPTHPATKDTPPLTGGFGGTAQPKWIRKTIMVEPANKATVNDIYHHVYLALREGVPFPIKTQEALDVVRTTEKIKLQNPAFKVKADEFGL